MTTAAVPTSLPDLPALRRGAVLPALRRGAVLPALRRGAVLPALRRGAVLPALRRGAVLAVLALAVTCWIAPPASAHGGDGVLALESFEPAGDGKGGAAWDVTVRLTYSEDGHAVDEATVTVAGEDGAGTPLTPVALAAQGDGRFAATVQLPPGSWNLRVVSVEPPAQLSLEPVTVPAATPSSTSTATAPSTTTTVVARSATSTGDAEDDRSTEGAAGSDLPWPLLIGAIVLAGILLVVAVRAGMRHRAGVDRLPGGPGGSSPG